MRRTPLTLIAVAAMLTSCGSAADTAATPPPATSPGATTTPPSSTADAPDTTTSAPVPSPGDRGPGPAPLTFADGMGSAAGEGVFPRTVTHHAGDATLETEPVRLVVIGTGQLDAVLTLGIVPAGAVQRDGAAIVQPYLVDAFPELADELAEVASVGTNSAVNFEAIAALDPDLILDNGGAEAETYDTLAAIAPTVITAGTGVNWKQDFRLIASALGRSDEADAFMDAYDADAAAVSSAVQDDRPTASFVRFNTGRARMFGVPSFAGSVAWDAGIGRPVSQEFDSTSEDLSEEQIALVDADWIFYSIQGEAADTPAGSFLANPLWGNLGAVQAEHVTVVADDPWYLSAGPTAATIVLAGLVETFAPG